MQSDYGFTTKCSLNKRCDRCDLPLHISTYKGVKVVYSKSKSKACGFLCVTCATRINRNQNVLATIEDLENFVSYLSNSQIKTKVLVE